jgi:hypothetical protein
MAETKMSLIEKIDPATNAVIQEFLDTFTCDPSIRMDLEEFFAHAARVDTYASADQMASMALFIEVYKGFKDQSVRKLWRHGANAAVLQFLQAYHADQGATIMATPDVRVRLSAEGVQEVIAAMKRIQDEAKKTEGVKALQKGFADLKNEIVGGLGVAAVVAGIAEVSKKALENAVAIGHMSEKVGSSVEMLSVLTVAAEDASVSHEDLFNGITKLAKAQDQAIQGSTKQVDAFKRLGITQSDLKKNDPGQMFVLVSQKLSQVESGSSRAAIAQTLLGKSGANLIPVMHELANGGFEQVQAKALRMGLVLSQDTVNGIKKAHSALIDIGHIAEGVATQFEAGFLPKAADAMEQLGTAISGNGVDGMKTLGEYAGDAARKIAFVFVATGHIIGAVFASIVDFVSTSFTSLKQDGAALFSALKSFALGDVSGGLQKLKVGSNLSAQTSAEGAARQKAIYSQLYSQLQDDAVAATTSSNPIGEPPKPKGGGDAGDLTAIAKARAAFLEAQAANELAILKAKNQLESQENDRNYRDGYTGLQDYYDKRATLIDSETDAEITALQKKRAAIKLEPADDPAAQINKQKQLDQIDAQITEKMLERRGKLAANEDERHNSTIQHGVQELELQSKIAGIEGDRDKAAKLALDAEIAKTEELLQKQGVAAAQIKKILDDMRSAGAGRIGFESASRQGGQAVNDLDLAKRNVQRQADTGVLNYIEAQAKIIQLERERIDTLKRIGAEMTKNAELSKDPSLIQQAKDFNAAVKDIEASTNVVGRALGQLKDESIKQGMQAFGQFVGDAVTGAQSLKDAWTGLEKSFQQIVSHMIAQLIELYLWMLLTKFLTGSSSDGGGGLTGSSNFAGGDNGGPFGDGGGFFSGDSGGWTGNMSPKKIAGVVHGQEYVVKAGASRALHAVA